MWECKCEVTYEAMSSNTTITLPITFTTGYWFDNDGKTDMLINVANTNKPTGYTVRAITLLSTKRI